MPTLIRSISLIVVVAAMPLSAQSLHPGMGVRVRAPAVLFERFEGVFLGRAGDTLRFGNDERGPVTAARGDITQLDISRGRSRWKGAAHGAMWGAGVGLALSLVTVAAVSSDGTSNDDGAGAFVAQTVIGSAELGAIIGAVIGKRKWVRAQPALLLNAGRIDIHSVGVELALRY